MKLFELLTEAPAKKPTKSAAEKKYEPQAFDSGLDYEKVLLDAGKKIAAYIKQHCKPWLAETQKGSLMVYRGFSHGNLPTPAFIKAVRPDRYPKDSDEAWHGSIDYAISLGNKKANRSNSLFTSGSYNTATAYGKTYVVIPIGAFNYTWHTKISDWHGSVDLQKIFQKKPEKAKPKAKVSKPVANLTPAQEKAWKKKRLQYLEDMKEVLEFGKELKTKFFPTKSVLLAMKAFVGMTCTAQNQWGDPHTYHHPIYIGKAGNIFPNIGKDYTKITPYIPVADAGGAGGGSGRYILKRQNWNSKYSTTLTYKIQQYIKKLSPAKRSELATMIRKMEEYVSIQLLMTAKKPELLFTTKGYSSKNVAFRPIYLSGSTPTLKFKPGQFKSPAAYEATVEKYNRLDKELKAGKGSSKFQAGANQWTPKDPIEQLDTQKFKTVFGAFLRGDDKTLASAIKSRNEIMIAADNAIAIQPAFYKDIVVPLLMNRKPTIDRSDLNKYLEVHGDADDY